MSRFFGIFAAIFTALMLMSCSPKAMKVDPISAGIKTTNWKAGMVFAHNVSFEQTNTKLGAGLQKVLYDNGWYATSSLADYRVSYDRISIGNPTKFVAGSECSLEIRYFLKDRNNNLIWSRGVKSSERLSIKQSLTGEDGVAQVWEKCLNENIKQFIAAIEPTGASLYDEQQSQITEDKLVVAFNNYDLFSDFSFFITKPYSETSIAARNKLLKDTKGAWINKLRSSSAQNCLKFLDTYRLYLDAGSRDEVSQIIQQKMLHATRANVNSKSTPPSKEQAQPKKEPSQPKKEFVEHKNPF